MLFVLSSSIVYSYTGSMYIAVDTGGTKTFVALLDEEGIIVHKERFLTNPDYTQYIEELCSVINKVAPNMKEITAIGMAAPGVMNYTTEHIVAFGNLPWHDVDLKHEITSRFNKPTVIDNDGNMGGLGESELGAGKGHSVVVYITISTGIGTGVVHDGSIDPTMAKSEAGMMHFKHDGENMLWEKFASGSAFVRRFGKQGKDVTDPAVWQEYAADLAMGFGSIIALIQPDVIVIGGSMGEHLEKYRGPLLHYLQSVRSPLTPIPQIVAAKDPENAVLKGCYVAAKRYASTR